MRVTSIFLIILAGALYSSSLMASDIVTIPFPGLYEYYENRWTIRDTLSFEMERIPTNVYSAHIRIVGESYPALCECDGWGALGFGAWRFQYRAIVVDPASGGMWTAGFVTSYDFHRSEIEPFDMTAELKSSSGATWAFLENGLGELVFRIEPPFHCYGASCAAIGLPAVQFSVVSLIIEADFLDGIDFSSWGTIKALHQIGD